MRLVSLSNLQQLSAINLTVDQGAIAGPIYVPSCAMISLLFSLTDGKTAHVNLGGRYSGAFHGTQAECNSMLAQFVSGNYSTLNAFFSSTGSLSAVTIRDINPPDGSGVVVQSNAAGVPGTSASPALPSEVALVVTKNTAKRGRSFRGRMYMANWATNAMGTGDTVAAAAVTALGAWASTLVGATLAAQGYPHVLLQPARAAYTSSITGRQFPARAATSEVITSLVVRDNHWDSQRRRGLK